MSTTGLHNLSFDSKSHNLNVILRSCLVHNIPPSGYCTQHGWVHFPNDKESWQCKEPGCPCGAKWQGYLTPNSISTTFRIVLKKRCIDCIVYATVLTTQITDLLRLRLCELWWIPAISNSINESFRLIGCVLVTMPLSWLLDCDCQNNCPTVGCHYWAILDYAYAIIVFVLPLWRKRKNAQWTIVRHLTHNLQTTLVRDLTHKHVAPNLRSRWLFDYKT